MTSQTTAPLRRAILIVALANLAYFSVEFVMARRIGSVSLFADSVDFLEDASVNLLILAALSWSEKSRAKVGLGLAALLLVPGLATLWTIVTKVTHPQVPDPGLLSITGLGALGVNLACALLLARYREHAGSLTQAAFLSARNDALANIAIILAGLATAATHAFWPDLIVGLGIAAMNLDAAKEVWQAARREGVEAKA
ncbi:MAG: cation transporter [Alphaproteobacteria bacterium]